MGNLFEGKVDAQKLRFGVIVSRYNQLVTDKLLEGALDALRTHGCASENIDIVRVPGSFEISLFAHKMAASGKYDALICLGAVIRGDTPHFEYIAREVAAGVSRAMIEHRIPVSFGVLTTDNLEQALERSAPNQGNKGYEAALTAIEMAHLNRAVP